jgi:hypothetical protein
MDWMAEKLRFDSYRLKDVPLDSKHCRPTVDPRSSFLEEHVGLLQESKLAGSWNWILNFTFVFEGVYLLIQLRNTTAWIETSVYITISVYLLPSFHIIAKVLTLIK